MAEPILQFFAYAHLPERLQAVSRPFGELAQIVATLPRNWSAPSPCANCSKRRTPPSGH